MRRYVFTEEELAFLRAIHEGPLDEARRLAYAERLIAPYVPTFVQWKDWLVALAAPG